MKFLLMSLFINYFSGAIPFSYLIVRLKLKKDIRNLGSGNAGATNTARILGLKYGIIVFMLDFLKGFLLTGITTFIFYNYSSQSIIQIILYYFSLVVILAGHIFPVYLNFRGGKGAASGLGLLTYLNPLISVITFVLWVIIFYFSKTVSLATIIATILLPLNVFIFDFRVDFLIFITILSLFVVIKHKSNIVRLIKGNEHVFDRRES
ncbi:MAG: glycerol-3-phosphate 1-O-acyltransferase PlsY [Candidatus Muiribacteriota bacterium]